MPRVSITRWPSAYELMLSALPRSTRKAQARVTGTLSFWSAPLRAMVIFNVARLATSGPNTPAAWVSAFGPRGSDLPSAATRPSPLRKPARAAPLPASTVDTCNCSL